MIGVRGLSGYLALISSIVLAVGAAVWLNASGEYAKVIVGLSVAAPPLLVAVLGPAFRLVPLLAAASVAYTVWFCLIARDQAEIAARNEFGALRLWPVAAAWAIGLLVVAVATVSGVRVARRRRARRAGRGART